jgi:hypothetical protein
LGQSHQSDRRELGGGSVIHILAHEVQESLQSKKYPIKVVYGPEAFKREADTSLIVILRDGESDGFSAPSGPGRNPRPLANRSIGFACLVFAKSSKSGARREDHEILCDRFVNALVCALTKVAHARPNGLVIGPGHLLTEPERKGIFERFPGVVYELKASLTMSVPDVDWDGNGLAEVELDAVSTDTIAVTPASADDPVRQYVGTVDVT